MTSSRLRSVSHLRFTISLLFVMLMANLTSCMSDGDGLDKSIAKNAEIAMQVTYKLPRTSSLPAEALTQKSPFRVMGYVADSTGNFVIKKFDTRAYCDESGNLNWIGETPTWIAEGIRFSAYWPSDADVDIDAYGHITSTDSSFLLIAETYPLTPRSLTNSLHFELFGNNTAFLSL